jgi:hypothetical protein
MSKKAVDIPVNKLPEDSCRGIMMMRKSFNGSPNSEQVERSHRDGGFTFIIQEKGKTIIEIDFQTHQIQAPAVIFIHPHQVHRVIAFEDAMICTWIITEESLRPEYLRLLEGLSSANVLPIKPETIAVLTENAALCMKLSEKKTVVLYHTILKESVNSWLPRSYRSTFHYPSQMNHIPGLKISQGGLKSHWRNIINLSNIHLNMLPG